MMKDELVKGLFNLFHENLSMIILYGSVARNEATSESDIDIRYDKIFSIIDIKEENMKKWGEVLPFYKNVQKEGVILWKAA